MPCKYFHEVGRPPVAGTCHSPGSPERRYEIDVDASVVCDTNFEVCPYYEAGEKRERREAVGGRA